MRIGEGTVCVVTGAGSGIGRALAEALAPRGAHLALVDRNQANVEQVADAVGADAGRVTTHVADVADRDRMQALAAEVGEAHGAVHLLINNAGVTAAGTFEEQSLDDFEWVIRINLLGVAYGCKVFLPLFHPTGAHIVNLSSAAGFAGLPGQVAYCTSKFGVRGMSQALRAELGARAIGVTSVHPGAIRTNIIRDMRTTDSAMKAKLIDGMEKFGKAPEAVARAIIRAVERNRAELVIGPDAHLIRFAQRHMPRAFAGAMAALYRRTMTS